MLIALPNVDGTFACILFLPVEGEVSFASLDSEAKFLDFFQANFTDAVPLMPQLRENFRDNPTGSMVTVKCSPWHVDAKSLLIGDAAHAIVPFFGQGMNCAFEDCTVLLELLDRHGADWPKVFPEFERARKDNTDAIADLDVYKRQIFASSKISTEERNAAADRMDGLLSCQPSAPGMA